MKGTYKVVIDFVGENYYCLHLDSSLRVTEQGHGNHFLGDTIWLFVFVKM